MSVDATWVVAHQGGWDELLILLAPVAIFAGLRLLERRRRRNEDGPEGSPGDETSQ